MKQLTIKVDGKTVYDYFIEPDGKMDYIQLTHSGNKAEVILLGNALATFILMGKEGRLKGKAYEDFLKIGERR
jgi:hypothetical protein